jgi:hypothetical protein
MIEVEEAAAAVVTVRQRDTAVTCTPANPHRKEHDQ